jgi:hypothetical protein
MHEIAIYQLDKAAKSSDHENDFGAIILANEIFHSATTDPVSREDRAAVALAACRHAAVALRRNSLQFLGFALQAAAETGVLDEAVLLLLPVAAADYGASTFAIDWAKEYLPRVSEEARKRPEIQKAISILIQSKVESVDLASALVLADLVGQELTPEQWESLYFQEASAGNIRGVVEVCEEMHRRRGRPMLPGNIPRLLALMLAIGRPDLVEKVTEISRKACFALEDRIEELTPQVLWEAWKLISKMCGANPPSE